MAPNLIDYAKFTGLQLFEQQLADHPLLIFLGTLQVQPVKNGLYISGIIGQINPNFPKLLLVMLFVTAIGYIQFVGEHGKARTGGRPLGLGGNWEQEH